MRTLSLLLTFGLLALPLHAEVLLWQKSLDVGLPAQNAQAPKSTKPIATDAAGNLFVAGAQVQWIVKKLAAADGSELWSASSGFNTTEGGFIATDAAGDVLVAFAVSVAGDSTGVRAMKFAGANGALMWERSLDQFRIVDIALDSAGNFLVLGARSGAGHVIEKLAGTTGQPLWEKGFPESEMQIPVSVVVDAAGNAIVVGSGVAQGLRIAKLSSANGVPLWSAPVGDAINLVAKAATIDSGGDVHVAGYRTVVPGDPFFPVYQGVAGKFSGATGATVWIAEPANSRVLRSIGIAPGGDAIAAGTGQVDGARTSMAVRLAAASGTASWVSSGPAGADGDPYALQSIAIDGAGGTLVPFISYTTPHHAHKVRGSDGVIEWVRSGLAEGSTIARHSFVVAVPNAVYFAGLISDGSTDRRWIQKIANAQSLHSTFRFPIEGTQETPPLNRVSDGFGRATFDPATSTLHIEVEYRALSGTPTGAHIHGAALRGATAGVVIDLGAGASPLLRSHTLDAAQAADLLAGKWYVNIHTSAYPSGEIRGQIDALGSAGKWLEITKSRFGSGRIVSSPAAIDCGATCGAVVPEGSVLTLTATPDAANTLVSRGSECAYISATECRVTVTSSQAIAFQFQRSPTLPFDFDRDGRPDLVFRSTQSGSAFLWFMNGTALRSDAFLATIDPAWQIVGHGDFDGDGYNDVLWRHGPSGSTFIWHLVAGAFDFDVPLTQFNATEIIEAVADFDGDGVPDVLKRDSGSGVATLIQFQRNRTAKRVSIPFTAGSEWIVEAAGDFNKDGRADMFFRNTATGVGFVWLYDGSNLGSSNYLFSIDPAWQVVQIADWNLDGDVDLVFRHATTGVTFVWYTNGTSLQGSDFLFQVDSSWKIVPSR